MNISQKNTTREKWDVSHFHLLRTSFPILKKNGSNKGDAWGFFYKGKKKKSPYNGDWGSKDHCTVGNIVICLFVKKFFCAEKKKEKKNCLQMGCEGVGDITVIVGWLGVLSRLVFTAQPALLQRSFACHCVYRSSGPALHSE